MANDDVKVTISHNQTIEGKDYKAGDTASLRAPLARVLVARGGARHVNGNGGQDAAKTTKKETSK